jgi:excisionase family DNA binding protein
MNQMYLLPSDLASRLNISSATLQRWRCEGKSPPYIKVGNSIRYRLDDVEKWEEEHYRHR